MLPFNLTAQATLPIDGFAGTLVGRAWVTDPVSGHAGPCVVTYREDGVFDISDVASTVSSLLERPNAAGLVRSAVGRRIGELNALLYNTTQISLDLPPTEAFLLAPCDLQVIKAAGVTFAGSLIERVIEERSKGDPQGADAIRKQIGNLLGDTLAKIRPGSEEAARVKAVLIAQGLWSQYLEVGIGPDAEIFTKAPVLSAIGTGAEIGLHPKSEWNNPEPEIVLAINSQGAILGATLGNDVNLRDFEGRSALLLSKAKDNNGSCAIGPFVRLFDETFSLDDVRAAQVTLHIEGPGPFELRATSAMNQISRDPVDIVAQTIGATHQYPDGLLLFLGTLFAPTKDREAPGAGFTHHNGDIVTINSPLLGALCNRVGRSDLIRPWTFGIRALMASLAARGLLNDETD